MKYRLIAYLLCCVLLIAPALAESGDDAVAWVDGEPISASLIEERLAAAGVNMTYTGEQTSPRPAARRAAPPRKIRKRSLPGSARRCWKNW